MKKYLDKIPQSIKLVLLVSVLYLVYKKIKKSADISALNGRLIDASGVGLPSPITGAPSSLNLVYTLESVWDECFENTFEDEEKIISLIKTIPVFRMREFALMWSQKVVEKKHDYTWTANYHKPTGLVEDLKYFLGNKMSQISLQINAI